MILILGSLGRVALYALVAGVAANAGWTLGNRVSYAINYVLDGLFKS